MQTATVLTEAVPPTRAVPSYPAGLLGVLPELQADPLALMARATFEHGPVVRLPVPHVDALVLGHPRLAEHVLVTNSRNYSKQTRGYEMLRKVLGNGLVTSEGAFWKRQRRIAQPGFHRERIAGFGERMARASAELVAAWEPRIARGESFDVAHEMMKLTLRIVGETLLSTDVTREADQVGEALTAALEHLIYRTIHPLALPEWVPTPKNLAFNRAVERLDAVVLQIIAERREGGGPTDDLLSMLMSARDPETGEGMDDAQLRDEVMTIFLAGHETTANALSWTIALLGRHPEVERRVAAELREVLAGRAPTLDDLPRLAFTSRVLKESMRLYPPVWSLGRRVEETEVVDGFELPKGALVFLSPYVLHRLPEFWADPEAFDPDRWATDDPRRNHGAYLPFSMGQRKCIGDTFALVEAQLVLATVLQRVHLSLVPGQTFDPEPVITLRPRHGVRVVATAR